jgi:hypothetical protein
MAVKCVCIGILFENEVCLQVVITVGITIVLLWVVAPCTVLFTDKCTASLVKDQYSAVYSLAS